MRKRMRVWLNPMSLCFAVIGIGMLITGIIGIGGGNLVTIAMGIVLLVFYAASGFVVNQD